VGKVECEIALPESLWVAGAAMDGAALVLVVHRWGRDVVVVLWPGQPFLSGPSELAHRVPSFELIEIEGLLAVLRGTRHCRPETLAIVTAS